MGYDHFIRLMKLIELGGLPGRKLFLVIEFND